MQFFKDDIAPALIPRERNIARVLLNGLVSELQGPLGSPLQGEHVFSGEVENLIAALREQSVQALRSSPGGTRLRASWRPRKRRQCEMPHPRLGEMSRLSMLR